jgi:hypothetical protein
MTSTTEKSFSADNINIQERASREENHKPRALNETLSSQSYHIFGVREALVHRLPCGMNHINIP